MEEWYFGARNNQQPPAWQDRHHHTMDGPRLRDLRIVPPPSPGGPFTTTPCTPLLAVAAAGDMATAGFRSQMPYQHQQYESPHAAFSPMGDSYASAILQAGCRRAPDVLGFQRPTHPEPYLSARFPTELHSAGPKRQGDPGQELTESARHKRSMLSYGSVQAPTAQPTTMPNSSSRVWEHSSPPPRFQRRTPLPTASPSQPRYVEPPPGFQYPPSPSHPSREQRGPHHHPSRHWSSEAGSWQVPSSTGGVFGDRVSTELCEAILLGAARLAQASPLTPGSGVDVPFMKSNATAPAQHLDTVTAMASGGPPPAPCARCYSWNRQLAEPSFQHPMHEATRAASTTTLGHRAFEHGSLMAPSQVPAPDRFQEERRNGSGLVGWPHLSGHEAEGDNFGVHRDSRVPESVQRPRRVCGKIYTP